METLNHHRLLTFTPMWSSFWKKNLNLYRFLGFPFASVHNTHFYLQEMNFLYGNEPKRYTRIEDRLIIGKRLRISFSKFVLFLLLIVSTNYFVSQDVSHFYFYIVVGLSILVTLIFSFFYSWEQNYKRTLNTIEENRFCIKTNAIIAKQSNLADSSLIASNKELMEELSTFRKKLETQKMAKKSVLLIAANLEFHFQTKELLLIEYFKFLSKEYIGNEIRINFNSFKQPEIVSFLQTKYCLENKKSAIEAKLRNRSFLNLNIADKSRKKDSNNSIIREVKEYLFFAGYKKAANNLSSYIEIERNKRII